MSTTGERNVDTGWVCRECFLRMAPVGLEQEHKTLGRLTRGRCSNCLCMFEPAGLVYVGRKA